MSDDQDDLNETATIKEISDFTGLSTGKVASIIHDAKIQMVRTNGLLGVRLDEAMEAIKLYTESNQASLIERDADIIRRLIPDIVASVSKEILSNLKLATSIRDTKESQISDLVASNLGVLSQIKYSINYLNRITAQIDLASSNILSTQSSIPTNGVSGFTKSLGIEKEVKVPSKEIQPPSLKEKEEQDHDVNTTEMIRKKVFKESLSSENSDDSMKEIKQIIHDALELKDEKLKHFIDSRVETIHELLSNWHTKIDDIPTFKSFYISLSLIGTWIEKKKKQGVPLEVIYLALSLKESGFYEVSDFFNLYQ